MKSVLLSVFQGLSRSVWRNCRLNSRLMVCNEGEDVYTTWYSRIMRNNAMRQAKTEITATKNQTETNYKPLYGSIEPRKRIYKPLRGNIDPRKRIYRLSLRGQQPPHCGYNIKQKSHCGFINHINEPLIKKVYQSECRIINDTHKRIPALNGTRLCYENAAFLTSQKTMKAVIDEGKHCFKTANDAYIHDEHMPIIRNAHAKPRARDREPSRIPVQKLFRILRKRRLRQKFRKFVKISTPLSSKVYELL